jgi:hypothetical protein
MTVRDADITKILPSTRQNNHRSDDLMDDDTDSARIYEIPGKWSIFVMFVLKKKLQCQNMGNLKDRLLHFKIFPFVKQSFRLSDEEQ